MRLANPRRGRFWALEDIRIPPEDNKAFSKLSKGFQVLQGSDFHRRGPLG